MARRKTVKAINFDKAVDELLKEYGDDVYKVLKESIDEVSKEAVDRLKAVNSFGAKKKTHITGAYSADWTYTDEPTGRFSVKRVVHNERHYRLAHLLEKGHVIRNGTQRTFGSTSGKEHIKPVNDWANTHLPLLVETKLKQL